MAKVRVVLTSNAQDFVVYTWNCIMEQCHPNLMQVAFIRLFMCFTKKKWTHLVVRIDNFHLRIIYNVYSLGWLEWGTSLCGACHVSVLGQLHRSSSCRVLLRQKETGWLDGWMVPWDG